MGKSSGSFWAWYFKGLKDRTKHWVFWLYTAASLQPLVFYGEFWMTVLLFAFSFFVIGIMAPVFVIKVLGVRPWR